MSIGGELEREIARTQQLIIAAQRRRNLREARKLAAKLDELLAEQEARREVPGKFS